MSFIEIDPDTFEGSMPKGSDLVIMERGDEEAKTALVLYGFDEIEMKLFVSDFKHPVYGFLTT